MERIQPILDFLSQYELAGNTLTRWVAATAIALSAFLLLPIVRAFVRRRAKKLAEKHEQLWSQILSELIHRTKWWFLLLAALFFGSLALQLDDKASFIVRSVAVIGLLLQAAFWGTATVTVWLKDYARQRLETDAASVMTMSALGLLAKLVIWSVVVLLALDNLGVNITAMVAGLGIGGVAVALAAQNVLGDLLASLSIVLDKPFVLGDFIIVGNEKGSVEHIGLKTTRVRSISGEQLVFSNNDLLQSRIRNYKRMFERRVPFTVGVTYQTPHDKLAAIPEMLREAVEAQQNVRFDRAHLQQFGDFAIVFEIVYYVLVADYTVYMDIQQAINLHLHRRFEEEGLEFAYPTQTIFVEQTGNT